MTEVFEPVDSSDRDLALRAEGLLGVANRAGLVSAADVHVASTLGGLAGEADERVLFAAALACRAVRAGSVCVSLAEVDTGAADLPWPESEAWTAAVAASPLVKAGLLRWESDLLYLDRYHQQETQVLDDLAARAGYAPVVDEPLLEATLSRVFPAEGYDEQRAACRLAVRRPTSIITGGPGTGKTTSVAALLVAMHEQFAAQGKVMRVALTAPTGKAQARLQESIDKAALPAEDHARIAGVEAMTLHRLLGWRRDNSTRFRHHRGNRLPHDVVIVDETSMVSLTMMARLLEAVRPDARLVLVGDPHQLSSVEAGAVLSDLVRGYAGLDESPVAALLTTRRFGGQIGALADAIREGDADAALSVLAAGHDEVEWLTDAGHPAIRTAALGSALAVRSAAVAGRADAALSALNDHRLLCAHRDGPFGVRQWNRRVEQWLTAETGDPLYERAYVGRPVLVTANDYAMGVFNGDAGVVVETPHGRRVALAARDGHRLITPSRLGEVETMHALTIHKSQGSQATEVTVMLPEADSRLLTRELFYTAVTRAQRRVRVVGDESWVRAAIERRAQRASGLAVRLSAPVPPGAREI